MLAVFVFKSFLQILRLRSVQFRSGQQKQIQWLNTGHSLLSPSHMLGWRWKQEGTRIFHEASDAKMGFQKGLGDGEEA